MLLLAWRNLWRNARRSVLTLASISCGVAAIMFGQSMTKTLQGELIEKATGSITGHIQLQHRQIKEFKFPDRYVDDPGPLEAALSRHPNVEAYARRITITGLVSSPIASVGALRGYSRIYYY